jgi:hypothetical protein
MDNKDISKSKLIAHLEWHKLEMLRLAQIEICCVFQHVLEVLIFDTLIGVFKPVLIVAKNENFA